MSGKSEEIFEYKLKDGEELSHEIVDGVYKVYVTNVKEWEQKTTALISELSKLYQERPKKYLDAWLRAW